MNDKKFKIANRCSFIFFTLYILTYIFLPLIEKNTQYLWFALFPCCLLISLIMNLLIKYNLLKSNKMENVSKIASIASILFNGSDSSSIYVGTMNWSAKVEEIKKYPSITPTWAFIVLFVTILNNFTFFMLSYAKSFLGTPISSKVILTVTAISVIFILLMFISSTFALLYNNGKKETFKSWKTIIIVSVALILIAIFSFWANGFSIKDEIQRYKDKKEFERHIQNIENTLNSEL